MEASKSHRRMHHWVLILNRMEIEIEKIKLTWCRRRMCQCGRMRRVGIRKCFLLEEHGIQLEKSIKFVICIELFGLSMLHRSIPLYFGQRCMGDYQQATEWEVGMWMLMHLVFYARNLWRLWVICFFNGLTQHKSGKR